ncbi:toxin [Lachnoclostridium sp. An169]|uniref:nucleotidyltransferase domain-containing protein n=1 Tax=Lachnoclostridium sp. An169 TaxID=1965569 RepID=UPI000B365850|nr:nucleotidyltransferase domain-containing protein [Lachnoclostridium sp. An169]OUP83640.1 toxin [Lachnoclostridium sp. An169]HJA66667.1 nucleotidyltransferase domain-containing protein [Candidatus Mediterraneibacter cottocaccae]
MQAEEVIELVTALCRKHLADYAVLYGSRAKGTARERSDIDIAVSGVEDFDSLSEAVEEIPTLYTVDLLNLDTCRNDLLLEDIRQYGRKIYEKI